VNAPRESEVDRSSLVEAATRLEEELRRYEKLTEEVARASIISQKSLIRATRMMNEAAESHERIMQQVGVLSGAMTETRGRQESCAEQLVEAGRRIERRATTFQALVGRYGALGELSRSLNDRAVEVASRKADGAREGEVLSLIGELMDRIGEAVEQADGAACAAREGEFPDLARDIDSLKQQVLSAKNRLTIFQRSLAERAPS
jgi:hypothetical protein